MSSDIRVPGWFVAARIAVVAATVALIWLH
jgi:hypothetical protein